jgi:isopenicillin N synthase-like dioxygenase
MTETSLTDFYRDTVARESFTEIPIIDVAPLFSDDPAARQKLADEIRLACMRVGFFYIKNHGVPQAIIDRAYDRVKEFYALPIEDKLAYHVSKSGCHRGFVPLYEESFYETLGTQTANKDHKECFETGIDLAEDDPNYVEGMPLLGRNVWPDLPGFKEDLTAYSNVTRALSKKLFSAFALALFLPEDYFDPLITRPPSVLRLSHYVENDFPQNEENWGISAHTDYEAFTILHTSLPGLQACNSAGTWVDVPPIDGTFIINIGDMIELLSNGAFNATSHRVLNLGRERFSFPLFCTLNYETVVAPLPQWVTEKYPAAYKPMRSGAHLFSAVIRSFSYLRDRWLAGELAMPEDAAEDTYFGRAKKLAEVA